jgi:hypothetical protein
MSNAFVRDYTRVQDTVDNMVKEGFDVSVVLGMRDVKV